MALSLSVRGARISKAEIRETAVEREGVGVVNLTRGVCDMEVSPKVLDRATAATRGGVCA